MSKELPPQQRGLSRRESRAEDDPSQTAGGAGRLAADDEAALEAFCAEQDFEELSFESWRQLHHSLDLLVELRLTAAELEAGGEREVEFVRSLTAYPGGPRRKERLRRRVRWQAGLTLEAEHVIILADDGDRCGTDCGSVRVRLLVF